MENLELLDSAPPLSEDGRGFDRRLADRRETRSSSHVTNLDHALDLVARGFRVFRAQPNQKWGYEGWQAEATRDPERVRELFGGHPEYGVAIATGDDGYLRDGKLYHLFVVDADVKDGARGLESLDLLDMLGLPFDFTVNTPSGGRHVYCLAPQGTYVKTDAKRLEGYPGLDVRGTGGLVLAPGTQIDGKRYTIDADREPAQAPPWLLDIVTAAKRKKAAPGDPGVPLDSEDNIARAKEWLRSKSPPAAIGERNNRAFETVAMVRDFAISADMALSLVDEHWNHNEAKVDVPLDLEELELVVESAYRGNADNKHPGTKSAFAEFDAVEIEEPTKPSLVSLAVTDPTGLGGLQIPPREWLVDGWIPAGKVTILSGDGGTGKTLLAQQLATACATKTPWLGMPVKAGKVLCLFTEDDDEEIWRRQQDINRATGMTFDDLNHQVKWLTLSNAPDSWAMMRFSGQKSEGEKLPFYKALRRHLQEERYDLVVIDPVANFFAGNELDRAQVQAFGSLLVRLCVEFDLTIVLLVHPSVAGISEGSGRSGSTQWGNAVRSRLFLKRPTGDPTGNRRTLETTKSNYGRFGQLLSLTWSEGALQLVSGSREEEEDRISQALLDALRKTVLQDAGALSPKSQARNYYPRVLKDCPGLRGISQSEIIAAFGRLADWGQVRTQEVRSNGRWVSRIEVVDDLREHNLQEQTQENEDA